MESIESLLAYLSACTCDTDPHRELHVARAILVWIAVMRGRSSIPGLPPNVSSLVRGDQRSSIPGLPPNVSSLARGDQRSSIPGLPPNVSSLARGDQRSSIPERIIYSRIAVVRGQSSIPGPDVTNLARGDPPDVFQKLCEYNMNLIHFTSINLNPY